MFNYKKIIKSRSLRVKLLHMLSFVPDKIMIEFQYLLKTGRKLNLKKPQRFTEKLQWYKLYYRDNVMPLCVDKYEVRKYVEECGLGHLLVPLLGLYSSPDEIDFGKLPNQFVIKDTLGGGGNSVIICKDKATLDIAELKGTLHNWIKTYNGKHSGREWAYDHAQHRIIIEEYIPSDSQDGGLIDYKFLSFNGKINYLYVIADRILGAGAEFGFFTRDFEQLPYTRNDERPLTRKLKRPDNFDELIQYAEILGKKFPHARIDMYDQNGIIYFGEITFFDGSGYMVYDPDNFDFVLGNEFELPKDCLSVNH